EAGTRRPSFRTILAQLLSSRTFAIVCLLSLGSTILRETFNTWTPLYLRDYVGYSVGNAARTSAIFPLAGAASVLIVGWLGDRLGLAGRSVVMCVGLAATGAALAVLTVMPRGSAPVVPLALLGIVAFCLLGPYSYLAGAFALDFGGREA